MPTTVWAGHKKRYNWLAVSTFAQAQALVSQEVVAMRIVGRPQDLDPAPRQSDTLVHERQRCVGPLRGLAGTSPWH